MLTTGTGCPVGDKLNSITVGPRGPLLLQDNVFLDEMAHFDRERIPERVVHAKGAGAFGYFEVTHDITKVCKVSLIVSKTSVYDSSYLDFQAALFSQVGKQTPIAVRFSTVGGESGSADTARDPRGFAVKFYTEEGNWDLVGNNTPIFFIRDPILFPSFVHSQKRNPVTHVKDPDAFWDFITLRPETTQQVSFLFSDRGTPVGYRFMNGYGSHTFKMVNAEDDAVYVKVSFTLYLCHLLLDNDTVQCFSFITKVIRESNASQGRKQVKKLAAILTLPSGICTMPLLMVTILPTTCPSK